MKCRLNICLLVAVIFMLAAESPAIASLLIEAASQGDTEKVHALLALGADVNDKDKKLGGTALMYAANIGHTNTVHALLAEGADVNAKDNDGNTALMIAKKRGHKEIVRVLKEAGAKE